MRMLNLNKQNILNYLFISLGFFASISIFISDILIFGIIIIWIIDRGWKRKWKLIKSCHFSIAIIMFLVFYVLGLIWGDLNIYSLKWIREQSLLIIIPIMISMSIPKKIIQKVLIAFLAGMCINAIMSIGSYLDFWTVRYHHYPNENVAVGFLDHFDHSVFLAFSTMILIAKFFESNNNKFRGGIAIFILLFIVSLFISHGRAGQYVFLMILGLFLLIRFINKPKYLILNISLMICFLTIMSSFSSTFNTRLIQGVQESINFFNLLKYSSVNTQDITVTDTPIGDRLTYLINYSKIVEDNLWLGCGTGNSMNYYQLLENKVFPNLPARPPHNNYLFILCEIGIIGLLLWLNIFIQLLWKIYKNINSVQLDFIKFILPIIFLFICLTDEYLVRHNSTLLFCLFTSLFCVRPDISTTDLKI